MRWRVFGSLSKWVKYWWFMTSYFWSFSLDIFKLLLAGIVAYSGDNISKFCKCWYIKEGHRSFERLVSKSNLVINYQIWRKHPVCRTHIILRHFYQGLSLTMTISFIIPDYIVTVVLLYVTFCLHRHQTFKTPLPPGPKGWPIVRNTFDMPTLKPWEVYSKWGKVRNATFIAFISDIYYG